MSVVHWALPFSLCSLRHRFRVSKSELVSAAKTESVLADMNNVGYRMHDQFYKAGEATDKLLFDISPMDCI